MPHRPTLSLSLLLALWLSLCSGAALASEPGEPPDRTRIASGPRGADLTLEAAPPSEERRQRLEAWFDLYRRVGDPARRAAAACFGPDERRPRAESRRACRELARWVLALTEAGVPEAPHFAVRRHVRAAVARMGAAAGACLTGRDTAARLHWGEARRSFAEADRAAARLGL